MNPLDVVKVISEKKGFSSGASLVELLLAIALFSIMLPALMTGFVASREGRAQQSQRYEATLLMSEAEEAVRSVREQGWTAIEANGVFHPQVNAGSWELVSGTETLGEYQRQIIVSDAYRDSSGDIVGLGGTVDPSTKQIDISVSWTQPVAAQAQTTFYITRFLENIAFTHTTDTDFSLTGAVFDSTETNTDIGDGEVLLSPIGGAGRSDWCQPDQVGTLDLPGQGNAEGITAIPFEAFIGTGGNASGVPLTYVTIDDNNPPTAINAGSYSTNVKTNDIFGEPGYAYLATDTNSSEMIIIGTFGFTEVGTFNSSGSSDGVSVYVSGDVGYLVSGSSLYTIDLTSRTGSRPQYDSVSLAGSANDLVVVGNYAYVAIDSTSNQLQIIDVSNSSNISVAASLTVAGQRGQDLHVSADENTVYLVTSESSTQNELFLIDVSTKSSPTLRSTYDTNGMSPQAVVSVLDDRRVLVVGTGAEEYQVVSVLDPDNPTRCGGLQVDSGIYGIDAVQEADSDAYAYVATGNSNAEFVIIEGGPGDTINKEGSYESGSIDVDRDAAFNSFVVTDQQPTNSSVEYQVAVADAVGGDCSAATYTFVGPDGTDATFFTSTPASIPFDNDGSGYENPGECFRYKAYFYSDDELTTSILESITVNYSP